MIWNQIHTTFLWVGIFVKTNTFCIFGKTSRVLLGKRPRTTSGTRTTGWEPLIYPLYEGLSNTKKSDSEK